MGNREVWQKHFQEKQGMTLDQFFLKEYPGFFDSDYYLEQSTGRRALVSKEPIFEGILQKMTKDGRLSKICSRISSQGSGRLAILPNTLVATIKYLYLLFKYDSEQGNEIDTIWDLHTKVMDSIQKVKDETDDKSKCNRWWFDSQLE